MRGRRLGSSRRKRAEWNIEKKDSDTQGKK